MKKIKYFILMLFLILLSGCKGEYDITIGKDLSVTEVVKISIDNKNDAYEKTIKLFENNNIDDSMYNISQSDEYVNINYEEKFNSFEDYILNSKFYSRIINTEDLNKDDKSVTFRGQGILKLDDNKFDSNLNNSFYITDLKINLTTPFIMRDNNADKVDGNKYTWTLDENDRDKLFKFSFDYLRKNNLYIIVIILCVGIVCTTGFIFIRNYLKTKSL